MTLTKAKITENIHAQCGFSKARSKALVQSTFEIIKDRLSSGEDIKIHGFGKFCVKDKPVRNGRNPATGNDIALRARRVVVFRWSPVLKEKLNGKWAKSPVDVKGRRVVQKPYMPPSNRQNYHNIHNSMTLWYF